MLLHERDTHVCMLTCKHDFCVHLKKIVYSSVTSQPKAHHTKYSLTVQCTVQNSPLDILHEHFVQQGERVAHIETVPPAQLVSHIACGIHPSDYIASCNTLLAVHSQCWIELIFMIIHQAQKVYSPCAPCWGAGADTSKMIKQTCTFVHVRTHTVMLTLRLTLNSVCWQSSWLTVSMTSACRQHVAYGFMSVEVMHVSMPTAVL